MRNEEREVPNKSDKSDEVRRPLRQSMTATVSLRLSHRTALTLSMSFTTVLPFHYPKGKVTLGFASLVSPAVSVTSGSESPPDSHSIPSVSLRYPKGKGCFSNHIVVCLITKTARFGRFSSAFRLSLLD